MAGSVRRHVYEYHAIVLSQFCAIKFKDGRVWEIDVKTQLVDQDPDLVADKILDIFDEYGNEIENIDFDVDTEKLKQDISSQTKDIF